jgi:hypothetical protein
VRTCSACAHPDADRLLAEGRSVRDVSRLTGVSRSALSRHRSAGHDLRLVDGDAPRAVDLHGERDHFAEALAQLRRAKTSREQLRALEAVRSALALELRDHSKSRAALKLPDREQLAQLERNVSAAWEAYEQASEAGLDVSLRALAGIREALGQLRAAKAKGPHVEEWLEVDIGPEGGPMTPVRWPASAWPESQRPADGILRLRFSRTGPPELADFEPGQPGPTNGHREPT